ncbi:hypothetical protein [Stenotrophomonas sp. SY1]|uniref:GNAT family N-acetyltransferase n=1 Tax=Stenotrophomonas sp. SY1 TaxID=477235 RepID=UPI001E523080|nr:hypothetical protein [Stenotrophomonas sp. SY1]MCD9087685.1 hypothetical protein [Stenotrophomonas sp. SY1]
MSDVRWTFPAMTTAYSSGPTAAPLPPPVPVQITSNGFQLRTLRQADVTPRFVEWINAPAMRTGLNLSPQAIDDTTLRGYINGFDGHRNHMIGIFDQGLLIGFYTLDVNAKHRVATVTAGIGETGCEHRRVYWATIDALIDHFFIYRNIDKITAHVLARNRAMLFNFIDNGRFFFEARLRDECLDQDGQRHDVLIFAAFHKGERPAGLLYTPHLQRALSCP